MCCRQWNHSQDNKKYLVHGHISYFSIIHDIHSCTWCIKFLLMLHRSKKKKNGIILKMEGNGSNSLYDSVIYQAPINSWNNTVLTFSLCLQWFNATKLWQDSQHSNGVGQLHMMSQVALSVHLVSQILWFAPLPLAVTHPPLSHGFQSKNEFKTKRDKIKYIKHPTYNNVPPLTTVNKKTCYLPSPVHKK